MDTGNDQGADHAPAWIETIPPSKAEGTLRTVYAGIAQRAGSIANILLSQSLHPEAPGGDYELHCCPVELFANSYK